MARHAHPSNYGRLILRSLVDAPPPADPTVQRELGQIGESFVTPLAPAQTTRKVHRGQSGPAPLGGTPVRSDVPRLPSGMPHVAHAGEAERSVKPPRLSTGSREPGGRTGSNVRPKR